MPSKYSTYASHARPRERTIHPIWRGVGFAMMVLIPIISYAAVDVLLKQNGVNNWLPIPRDLLARQGQFLYSIIPDPMINIKLILFVVIMFLLYLIFLFLGMLITSMLLGGPERSDPYYVPPLRRQRRRR